VDKSCTGRYVASLIPVCKDLEDGNWIGHVFKEWVNAMGGTKMHPPMPWRVGSVGMGRNNSSLDGLLCSAEITVESIASGGVHRCQDCSCG